MEGQSLEGGRAINISVIRANPHPHTPRRGGRDRRGGLDLARRRADGAKFMPVSIDRQRQADLDPGDPPPGTRTHDYGRAAARMMPGQRGGRWWIPSPIHELVDPAVSSERLLYRLFHERGVRVFEPLAVREGCNCSRERIMRMLAKFSPEDRRDMIADDGRIGVTCEFLLASLRSRTGRSRTGPSPLEAPARARAEAAYFQTGVPAARIYFKPGGFGEARTACALLICGKTQVKETDKLRMLSGHLSQFSVGMNTYLKSFRYGHIAPSCAKGRALFLSVKAFRRALRIARNDPPGIDIVANEVAQLRPARLAPGQVPVASRRRRGHAHELRGLRAESVQVPGIVHAGEHFG